VLARFGELHPEILAAFDVKVPASAFEVFLDAIPEPKAKGRTRGLFQPSQFPAVERDFAFVVDANVTADDIIRSACNVERSLIERVDVFDIYEGAGVPEERNRSPSPCACSPGPAPLTDAEIEAVAQKIVSAVMKATGGTLRT